MGRHEAGPRTTREGYADLVAGDNRATPVEAVVDTGAHSVHLEAHVRGGESRATGAADNDLLLAGHRAEVDVQVFSLHAPSRRDRPFDTSAGGPTHAGLFVAAEDR